MKKPEQHELKKCAFFWVWLGLQKREYGFFSYQYCPCFKLYIIIILLFLALFYHCLHHSGLVLLLCILIPCMASIMTYRAVQVVGAGGRVAAPVVVRSIPHMNGSSSDYDSTLAVPVCTPFSFFSVNFLIYCLFSFLF